MKIESDSNTLRVTALKEITEASGGILQETVRNALAEEHDTVEIDLASVRALDSGGVSALVALYEMVARHRSDLTMRVLNPAPPVRQLLELMRLHHLVDITPSRAVSEVAIS